MAEAGNEPINYTSLQKFGLLTKFMLPLVLTQMVPDIAEQVINRGITSIASDDLIVLLASYGLAYYVTKVLTNTAMELRAISIVLVHNKQDNLRMTALSIIIGALLSGVVLLIGLSPLGTLLIRDVHRQSQEVSDTTCTIMTYLCLSPLIEGIAYYYEGGLVYKKLTGYAGIAKLADFGFQILFTIVLMFTPTRTEPVLVPVFSLYAGIIGRLILSVGFWYVLVRKKLPERQPNEKPLGIGKTLWFWFPLVIVRVVQMMTRPAINLVVSRDLASKVSKEAAAKAVAVLTAVYPTGRFVFSWLNDLRTIAPTFHKQTKTHKPFSIKVISLYSAFCTLASFTANAILFIVPGPAFFIMKTVIGLNEELAELSLVPLKIFTLICLCVGLRAHLSGLLIMKKKTVYLTPSAVFRFLGLVLFLWTLPQTRLAGAVLGITCLVLSFAIEAVFVAVSTTFLKFQPKLRIKCFRSIANNNSAGHEDASNKETSAI